MSKLNATAEQVEEFNVMVEMAYLNFKGVMPPHARAISGFLRDSVQPIVLDLVREYVSEHGWPEGAVFSGQPLGHRICFYKQCMTEVYRSAAPVRKATDWQTAIITKEDLGL